MDRVYVLIDDENRIVAVESSFFLRNADGWIETDSGEGDRYRHAQNNYLPGPQRDELGRCRYKWERGQIVERTAEELAADALLDEPQSEEGQAVPVDLLAALAAAWEAGVDEA